MSGHLHRLGWVVLHSLWQAAAVAGVLAAALRLAVGWSLTRRLVATAAALHDPSWHTRLTRWKTALGIAAPIRLLASARVDVPIVVGWLRPVVIWPVAAVTGMPPEQIDAILAHELAHVRRHDVLVNLVQSVIEAMFFHHPAAWWISAQVRAEREHCADELAIRALAAGKAGSRISYATALLSLEERRQSILVAAANGGSLGDRIRRLAGIEQQGGDPTRLAAAVVVLAAVVATLATPPGNASRQAMAAEDGNGQPAVPVATGTTAELPEDTNTIESLTPEQARKLAEEFPGVTVEIEVVRAGRRSFTYKRESCLPLNGLKKLAPDVARALAGYSKGPLLLNGLTTLDADSARALVHYKGTELDLDLLTTLDADTAAALTTIEKWNGELPSVIAFKSPDSVAIAKMLAARKGRLSLSGLRKISPKTLAALIEKEDVEIPPLETLELIPEPDGSPTEDFVIPEGFRQRQQP